MFGSAFLEYLENKKVAATIKCSRQNQAQTFFVFISNIILHSPNYVDVHNKIIAILLQFNLLMKQDGVPATSTLDV